MIFKISDAIAHGDLLAASFDSRRATGCWKPLQSPRCMQVRTAKVWRTLRGLLRHGSQSPVEKA